MVVDDLEAIVRGLPPRRMQAAEPELATRYVRTTRLVQRAPRTVHRGRSSEPRRRALAVLRGNDTGALRQAVAAALSLPVELGLGVRRDRPRARRSRARADARCARCCEGQWADGMVPHIVFHPQPVDYWPGPELWGSQDCEGAPEVATSGLTQPPVLATAVRALHEAAPDAAFLEEVVPKLEAWHDWFHRERAHAGVGAGR